MAKNKIKNPSTIHQWHQKKTGLDVTVYRSGNFCTIFIGGQATAQIGAFTQLTDSNIDVGYRPPGTVEFFNYGRNITFYMNDVGLLRAREVISSGTAISASFTYITENADPS